MKYQASLQKSGFRELNVQELHEVSGGYYHENSIPDFFEDQFPSITSILGIDTWGANGDGGGQAVFGTDADGHYLIVFSSASGGSGGDGAGPGSYPGYHPDNSTTCNMAHTLSVISGFTGYASGVFTALSFIPDPSTPITVVVAAGLGITSTATLTVSGILNGVGQCNGG